MDDKKKIIKAIVLILLIVACIPVKTHIKDGGSEHYQAFFYSVTKVHCLTFDDNKRDMDIDYDIGYEVCVLGVPLVDTSECGAMAVLEGRICERAAAEKAEENEWIQGTAGGETVYQNVPTEVVSLRWSEAADMPPYIIQYEKQEDGTVLCWTEEYDSDEQLNLHKVDEKVMDRLSKWVDTYEVKSWDGFDMSDTGVCDGWGFSINITLSTGETITAHGYMAYPDNFHEAIDDIHGLLH